MAKPYEHAKNSAEKFGGEPKDYLEIHEFMDSGREVCSDMRHRSLTHHSWFVYKVLVRVFGSTINNSDGIPISVAEIGEQHVKEDFNGEFPTAFDFIQAMETQDWMRHCENALPPSVSPQETKTLKPVPTRISIPWS